MSSTDVIEEMLADIEEFLDGTGALAEVADVLEELAALGRVPAPVPNRELAPHLAAAPPRLVPVPGRRHDQRARPARTGRRVAAGLAAAAVSSLTLTGVAAVANELPPGLQRTVAHFSEHYLPFSLPRPVGDPPAAPPPDRGSRAPGAPAATGSELAAHVGVGFPGPAGPGAAPDPAGPSSARHGGAVSGTPAAATDLPATAPTPATRDSVPPSPDGTLTPSGSVATGAPSDTPSGTPSDTPSGSPSDTPGGASSGPVRAGTGHLGNGVPTPSPTAPGPSGHSHGGNGQGQGGGKPTGDKPGGSSTGSGHGGGDGTSGGDGNGNGGGNGGGNGRGGGKGSGGDGTDSVTQSPGA